MFESFRKSSDALQELAASVLTIQRILLSTLETEAQRDLLKERVETLELGYAKWSAEAEATMLKADALFKNARNSEERAREMKKKANGRPEDSVEGEAEIRAAYVELYGIPEEDVENPRALRSRLVPTNPNLVGVTPLEDPLEDPSSARTRRLRAKFR